ncbi:MAG: cytochrome b/b6 domain-containing protein [Hyphomicrobiaceae bacterium]
MALDKKADGTGSSEAGEATVAAWDVPTRLFHWTLVSLIIAAYFTREFGGVDLYWHKICGYSILILIVYRVLWGFVGSSTARFTSFVKAPWTALAYARDFALGRPRHFLGHNPLGGGVVIAILALVGAQAMTGLFASDDALAEGPLVKLAGDNVARITALHHQIFDLILVVVVLHIAANFIYLFWKKENLIRPMVTGRKPARGYEDANEADLRSPLVAVVCLVLAAAIVLGGITLAGGRLL